LLAHESFTPTPGIFDAFTAAIYRAKVRVLQLIEYEMVLFFDSDVVFHQNCDDLFDTTLDFVGRKGSNSPFNAGLFLVRPSWQALVDINDVALSASFDSRVGWLQHGPIPDWRPAANGAITDWSFYGGSVEQGLFYYYYFCHLEGKNAALVEAEQWEGRRRRCAEWSQSTA
jgi:hypothetical protein